MGSHRSRGCLPIRANNEMRQAIPSFSVEVWSLPTVWETAEDRQGQQLLTKGH